MKNPINYEDLPKMVKSFIRDEINMKKIYINDCNNQKDVIVNNLDKLLGLYKTFF